MRELLPILSSLFFYSGVFASGNTACILRNGTLLFVSPNEICCENVVKERKPGEDCCIDDLSNDSRFYQTSTTLCCNGVLHPRYSAKNNTSVEYACCKKNSIPKEKKICCLGAEHDIPEGGLRHRYSCCGRNLRHPGEICCNNNPLTQQKYNANVGCCKNATYDKRTHWCQGSVIVSKHNIFCENKLIDLKKQSCCDDTINDWPYFKHTAIKDIQRGCCGNKAYNKTTDSCCYYGNHGSYTMKKEPYIKCCGPEGPYNKNIEICCNGKKVLKEYGNQTGCCGKQGYNRKSSTEDCCNGKIINRKSHKCCSGSLSIEINGTCCGKLEQTPDSLCCKNVMVLKKTKPDQDSCCLSYYNSTWVGQPYNSKSEEEICHNGELRQIKKDGSKWCGFREKATRYHPEKAVCCSHRLYAFPPGVVLKCCGMTAYDEQKQTCRYNILFNVSKNDIQFPETKSSLFKIGSCNGIAYRKLDMFCCGKTLHKKGRKRCCGGRVIGRKSECCNGIVLPAGTKCCGGKAPFNPGFQECDNRKSVVRTTNKPINNRYAVKNISDSFSWIRLVCQKTNYAFVGTVHRINDKRRRYTMLTFTKVKWLGQQFPVKKVKLQIYCNKRKLGGCTEQFKNNRVVIFTSIQPKKESAKVLKFNVCTHKHRKIFVTNFSKSFRRVYRSVTENNLCERGLDKYYV